MTKNEGSCRGWLAPILPDPAGHLRRSYERRRVLVVGADGFLGVNCVLGLCAVGAYVSVLTRKPASRTERLVSHVYHGDLRDSVAVQEAVRGQEIVFDLAGGYGAVQSNCDPQRNLLEESQAQLVLLQTCAEMQPSPIVLFCSSRLVYGRPQTLPVREDHPLAPESIYAVHKISAENYLRVFRRTAGLRSVVVRLTNPYGPYQAHESKSYGILNHFVRTAARGGEIRVFGDGSQHRDYLYVDDAVRAFLLLAASERCHLQLFNLGGSESVSVRQAAEQVARLAGTRVKYVPWPDDFASVETGDYRSDSTKLKDFTGFEPQVPLAIGLQRTLEFYRATTPLEEALPTNRLVANHKGI